MITGNVKVVNNVIGQRQTIMTSGANKPRSAGSGEVRVNVTHEVCAS